MDIILWSVNLEESGPTDFSTLLRPVKKNLPALRINTFRCFL